MRSAAALLLSIAVAPSLTAQTRVEGTVTSRGEPLARARVLAVDSLGGPLGTETFTNAAGQFQLRVAPPRKPRAVVAHRLGFRPETVVVVAGAPMRIALEPAPVALAPTLIVGPHAARVAAPLFDLDELLRTRESPQALLQSVPGLIIAQHGGGGKAEQIFLRGFDADHGTDVAVSVGGVPVNMVSHAHGQGYADLHWIIPETVDGVEARKGAFDTEDGDFATAGAVALRLKDRIERGSIATRVGSFGSATLTTVAPFDGGYVALSGFGGDGPFALPQRHRRVNGLVSWQSPVAAGARLQTTVATHGSRWNQSGQIPLRAVSAGALDRFGAMDSTEGGWSERHSLTATLSPRAGDDWQLLAYATRYRYTLFSNFTFFADDSVNGDGIEQRDDRWSAGARARRHWLATIAGRAVDTRAGIDARVDRAGVALYKQAARRRLGATDVADVAIGHLGLWADQRFALRRWAQLDVGARADGFSFGVLADSGAEGRRHVGRVSPRATLMLAPLAGVTLSAAAGRGFHSNDARAASRAGATGNVVPRSRSLEAGARYIWSAGAVGGAVWRTDLEDELVWSGDGGVTESGGRSLRRGVDLDARLRIREWLWADGDVSLARGRLLDAPAGEDRVPLAPPLTASLGLAVPRSYALNGALRLRHVGDRPASEDGSVVAFGHTLLEASARWTRGAYGLFAGVENATNARWNEAQFATTARLRGESAALTDLHFTPGTPRAFHIGLERAW